MTSVFSLFGSIPNLLPRKAKPPQAQVPRLIGVVKTVNSEDRFVLIDATTFRGAEAGDLLICIRDQKETANLRMSTLKNPPFSSLISPAESHPRAIASLNPEPILQSPLTNTVRFLLILICLIKCCD